MEHCGRLVLNITDMCNVKTNMLGDCNRTKCVDAISTFFFNSPIGDSRFTKPFFECCEHEEKCIGISSDIYAPWECIDGDPFYSCNVILQDCRDDNDCNEIYNEITRLCPAEMFSPIMQCPATIPAKCELNLRQIEGWYCSCRFPSNSSDDDEYMCNARKQLFTHNRCLETADIFDSTNPTKIFQSSLNWIGSALGFVLLICMLVYACCNRPWVKNGIKQPVPSDGSANVLLTPGHDRQNASTLEMNNSAQKPETVLI